MKEVLSRIMICLLAVSCQSQKLPQSPLYKTGHEYFSGSWILVEKRFDEENQTKIFPLHECMKKYELRFRIKDPEAFFTKIYAAGKNCAVMSSSGEIPVSITNSAFSYSDYDLRISEQYRIYSENQFSVLYHDIINGKVTEIEDVYQRK